MCPARLTSPPAPVLLSAAQGVGTGLSSAIMEQAQAQREEIEAAVAGHGAAAVAAAPEFPGGGRFTDSDTADPAAEYFAQMVSLCTVV